MFYQKRLIQLLLFTYTLLISTAQAADTDIYFSSNSLVNPNILFVLDSSGSMQLPVPSDPLGRNRMKVMQDSLNQVLDNASPFLNVGIMNFSGHNNKEYINGPSFPVLPIDDPALAVVESNLIPLAFKKKDYQYQGMFDLSGDNIPNPVDATVSIRNFLKQVGGSWKPEKFTPIADALYEAARYYRGEEVDWGNHIAADKRAAHPSTYDGYIYRERSATTGQACTSANTCQGSQCSGKTTYGCQPVSINKICNSTTASLPSSSCGTSCSLISNSTKECGLSQSCGYNCSTFTKTISKNFSSPQAGYSCTKKTSTKTQNFCIGNKYDPESGKCLKSGSKTVTNTYYQCTTTETRKRCTIDKYQCKKDVQECLYDECKNTTTVGTWTTKKSPLLRYKSPINQSCQNSFIVLLSDGGPDIRQRSSSVKTAALDKLKNLSGNSSCQGVASQFAADPELQTFSTTLKTPNTDLDHGLCGPELTEALATKDQIDDSKLTDMQTIGTYTIGFGLDPKSAEEGYLKLLAKKGLGNYFAAKDANSLVKAFNDILASIGSSASTFSAPTYAVNESTLFSHEDDVFMPSFSVSNFPRWSGNLKKYKLIDKKLYGKKGTITLSSTSSLTPAVDEQGVFEKDVSDMWSSTAKDGGNVTAGGVANLLDPANRKLFSNLTGNTNVDLTLTTNKVDSKNISSTDLGLATADSAYAQKLVSFIQGYEDDGVTARRHMGDILHSKPVIISYDNSGTNRFIFVGTNEGYLHAFDTDTGQEKFAFMPKELLKNIDRQYKNNDPKTHDYGLDGEITVWKHDANDDGKINKADNDFVYLFFGMRRGGRNVYAMDITEINKPKLLWKVAGGSGDFNDLGQTWSTPALAKMHSPDKSDNGKLIDVLIFGAGYDPALDEEDFTLRKPDVMGTGVYIVNAKTGKHLWSETLSASYSVPSEIRVLDMDKNGSIDRLYFGDTGGNLWRADLDLDIRDGITDTSLYDISKAKLTRLADLGGTTGSDPRKFFNEPDVSLVKQNGKTVLLISIGSGYRARPLHKGSNDRFYVLIDEDVKRLPLTTLTTKDSDLLDVNSLAGQSIIVKQDAAKKLGKTVKGWLYDLPNPNEKVLSASATFLGKIMFTTFTSDGVSSDPCSTPPSSGRAYVLDILTGNAVLDLDRDGFITQADSDKSVIAGTNEILGTPQLVFNEPKTLSGKTCTETDCHQYVDIRVGKKLTPIADRDNSDDNTPISSLDLGKILPRSYWLDHDAIK